MSAVTQGHLPSTTWQKYQDYDCPVDPKQNDRATTIKLLSLKKPHMRAFWVSVSKTCISVCYSSSLTRLLSPRADCLA
eukprot:12668-Heterococcus_DN1.PRE.1